MTEPMDREKTPGSGLDVFNMKPNSKPNPDASQGDAAAPDPHAQGSGWALKAGPVHFAVIAVLIACAWIGWPYVSRPAALSGQLGTSPQVLMPNDARGAERELLTQPDVMAPNSASTMGGPAPATLKAEALAPGSGPEPAAMAASTQAPVSPRETELQATVADLQAKLASAEARAAAVAPSLAQAAPLPPPTSNKARSKLQRASSRRVADTRVALVATLRDYTLNTVYRDQAWIQDREHTYVVRAGDIVNDVRIVRVDSKARQVFTSRGVIQ